MGARARGCERGHPSRGPHGHPPVRASRPHPCRMARVAPPGVRNTAEASASTGLGDDRHPCRNEARSAIRALGIRPGEGPIGNTARRAPPRKTTEHPPRSPAPATSPQPGWSRRTRSASRGASGPPEYRTSAHSRQRRAAPPGPSAARRWTSPTAVPVAGPPPRRTRTVYEPSAERTTSDRGSADSCADGAGTDSAAGLGGSVPAHRRIVPALRARRAPRRDARPPGTPARGQPFTP